MKRVQPLPQASTLGGARGGAGGAWESTPPLSKPHNTHTPTFSAHPPTLLPKGPVRNLHYGLLYHVHEW